MPDNLAINIAYLAPEIPALSATFVYNEILEYRRQGIGILPISVHRPKSLATEITVKKLTDETVYLYNTPKLKVAIAHFAIFLTRPRNYLSAFGWLIKDIFSLGISRDSAGLIYRFFYAAELARVLGKKNIQHLHIHFAHIPTDIGMYATKMQDLHYSVMAHANDLFERGYLLKQKVARSVFFATISEYNRRYLVKHGVEQSKLKLIRCGVDSQWQPPKTSIKTNTVFTIGTVGRLVEKKGFDVLLDAAATLLSQGIHFKIKLAGNGPLEDELHTQAKKLGLDDVVEFLGPLSHDAVANFINELDLFVLPCKADKQGDMDGIPVVLMEAMLCGVPVISTQLSGIPELVKHEQTGWLVAPDNATLLSEAILKLQFDSALRDDLAGKAKQWVQTEFMLDTNVKRLQALIQQSIY